MDTTRMGCFIIFLFWTNNLPTVLANEATNDTILLTDRIFALQTGMQALCSYVEQTMVETAANFVELIGDAHRICPDYKRMERVLANVAEMADNHYSSVKKQRNECNKLSKMLTDELEGGDSLVDYFTGGDYSFASEIIDKWYLAFTKFQASFPTNDIPIEIIHNNRIIFFYDSWSEGIKEFLFTLSLLLVIPSVVTLIAIFIYQCRGVNKFFNQSDQTSLRAISHTHSDISDEEAHPIVLDNSNVLRRRMDPPVQTFSGEGMIDKSNNFGGSQIERKHNAIRDSKFSFLIVIILWIFIFSLLMIIMLTQNPTLSLVPKSVRRNWYPATTLAIAQMRNDTKNLDSNITSQIISIEQLHHHASMCRDPDVQQAADEFATNFDAGVSLPSEEMANAYLTSKRVSSVFQRTYGRIEAHAKKLGKLEQTKDLLKSLNESAHHYKILNHKLAISIEQQRHLLPVLKQHTNYMHTLLQKDALIHIIPIAEKHYTILMDIVGNFTEVNVVLNGLIEIVGNNHAYGMKKSIVSITEETLTEQVGAMYNGRPAGIGATIGGVLVFMGGYALATVTATAIAGPLIAATGGPGMVGFGIYYASQNYKTYNEASRYVFELEDLEIERGNMRDALKKFHESIDTQLAAFESSRSSLSILKQTCNRFLEKSNYPLNTKQRTKISKALDKLLANYNRMIATHSAIVQDSEEKQQALSSS